MQMQIQKRILVALSDIYDTKDKIYISNIVIDMASDKKVIEFYDNYTINNDKMQEKLFLVSLYKKYKKNSIYKIIYTCTKLKIVASMNSSFKLLLDKSQHNLYQCITDIDECKYNIIKSDIDNSIYVKNKEDEKNDEDKDEKNDEDKDNINFAIKLMKMHKTMEYYCLHSKNKSKKDEMLFLAKLHLKYYHSLNLTMEDIYIYYSQIDYKYNDLNLKI